MDGYNPQMDTEQTQRRYDMFHKPYRARTWNLHDLADVYARLCKSRAEHARDGNKDYYTSDFLDYETALVAGLEKALGVKAETVRIYTAPDGTEHTHHDGFDGRSSLGHDFTSLCDYLTRVEQGPFGIILEGAPLPGQAEFEAPLRRAQAELIRVTRSMIHQVIDQMYPEAAERQVSDDQLAAVGFDPKIQREPDEMMYL